MCGCADHAGKTPRSPIEIVSEAFRVRVAGETSQAVSRGPLPGCMAGKDLLSGCMASHALELLLRLRRLC